MSGTAGSVIIDLDAIEVIIRDFERDTSWAVSLSGRGAIQQFFVSVASDSLGFADPDSIAQRNSAMQAAQNTLLAFLNSLIVVAQSKFPQKLKESSDNERIGFLLIVQNLNGWASQMKCSCWPR